MKIVFKKIPRLAVGFYLVGILLIAISIYRYLQDFSCSSIVLTQQLFIVGAIVVALGSVINTLYHFKK